MQIEVRGRKLRAALENEAECRKRFGVQMTKKLMLRVNALGAAESLADFWPPKAGSERCHELKGGLAGTFSMDLNQPHRLLFEAVDGPRKEDEPDARKRWALIKSVVIIDIEDTHG